MTTKSDLKKHIRARQAKTGESYTTARMHVLRARDGEMNTGDDEPKRVTGVVLKCNESSVRVRINGEEGAVTLRCSSYDAWKLAPAQLIDVTLTKRWTFGGHAYMSGTVERAWTDIPALGLEPLSLENDGVCDLNESYAPFEPPDPYAPMWEFFASTPREAYEFDPIAWGAGVGIDPDDDRGTLVGRAADLSKHYPDEARELLMEILLADLRCIDAHVHLGNLVFDADPEDAVIHYEIAIAIGELSLPPDFNGMIIWGQIYNRPFLRALHAYGLCLWRLGQPEKAKQVFERVLSYNPPDNQGARFCWDDIRNGRPWRPDHVDDSWNVEQIMR